jgi:UDP-N-acetylglucosamine:LPS N-acetylglucosamine transferase
VKELKAYEQAKAAWLSRHPDATPEQIETAMKRIADEVGV